MLELTPAHTPVTARFEDAPVFRAVAHTLGLPGGDTPARPGAVIAPTVIPGYLEVAYGPATAVALPPAVTRHLGPLTEPPTHPIRLPSPYDTPTSPR